MDGEASEPLQTYEELIYRYLDIALDCDIDEWTFWDMTIAELERFAKSRQRTQKTKAQEQAVFDYILASLIGANVASVFGDSKVPPLAEVYSTLFEDQAEKVQEQKQDLKAELSAIRFRQFAESYNKRLYKTREVANLNGPELEDCH